MAPWLLILFLAGEPLGAVGPFADAASCARAAVALPPVPTGYTLRCLPKTHAIPRRQHT